MKSKSSETKSGLEKIYDLKQHIWENPKISNYPNVDPYILINLESKICIPFWNSLIFPSKIWGFGPGIPCRDQ